MPSVSTLSKARVNVSINSNPNYMTPLKSKSILQHTPTSARGLLQALSGQKCDEGKNFDSLARTGVSSLSSPPLRPLKDRSIITSTARTTSSLLIRNTHNRPTMTSHSQSSVMTRPTLVRKGISSTNSAKAVSASARVSTVNSLTTKPTPPTSRSMHPKLTSRASPAVAKKSSPLPINAPPNGTRRPMSNSTGVPRKPVTSPTKTLVKLPNTNTEINNLKHISQTPIQVAKPPRYSMHTVTEEDEASMRPSERHEPAELVNGPIVPSMDSSPRFILQEQLQKAPTLSAKSTFSTQSIDPIRVRSDDAHFIQLQASTESFSLNSTGNSALNQGMCVASDSEFVNDSEFSPRSVSLTANSPRLDMRGISGEGGNRSRTTYTVRLSDGLETPYASYMRPPQRPGASSRPRAFSFDSVNRSSDRSMEAVLLNTPVSIFPKAEKTSSLGGMVVKANSRSSTLLREHGREYALSDLAIDALSGSPVLKPGSSPVDVLNLSYQSIGGDNSSDSGLGHGSVAASTSSIGCEVFLDRTAWSHSKGSASGVGESKRRDLVDAQAIAYVTRMAAQMTMQAQDPPNAGCTNSSAVLSESFLSDDAELHVSAKPQQSVAPVGQVRSSHITPLKDNARAHKRTPATALSSTPASANFRTPAPGAARVKLANREEDDSETAELGIQDPVARQLLMSDGLEYFETPSKNSHLISPIFTRHTAECFFSPLPPSEA